MKPSKNTDQWDRWKLRVDAEELDEEGKVTPIAFWSISKKKQKGTLFHLYDRLKQRVLLFPVKGYLALPNGVTNNTEEFGVPMPPYDFAVREQNGQLSFQKPSEWFIDKLRKAAQTEGVEGSNNPQPPPNETGASIALKARRRKRVNTVKFGLNALGIKIPKQRFKTVAELLELVKENAQDILTETLAKIQRGKQMKLVPVLSLEERISDPSLAERMDIVPLADQLDTVDQGLDDRGGDKEMDIVSEEEEVNHASYDQDEEEEEDTGMNISKL
ncbi:hypothetical protein C8J56DRAFT_893303 [Mycena floridula]|nr:hypothetical protein C8J56DRAFT_893303 [Mycena floridula]